MEYTLGQKQRAFVKLLAHLIDWAYRNGYELTFAEAYRPPDVAKLYAKQGRGVENSLHGKRLAVDLNLFKNGVYLTKTEDYLPLGENWESYSTPGLNCVWGGRFKRADGNHFSIEHGGIR